MRIRTAVVVSAAGATGIAIAIVANLVVAWDDVQWIGEYPAESPGAGVALEPNMFGRLAVWTFLVALVLGGGIVAREVTRRRPLGYLLATAGVVTGAMSINRAGDVSNTSADVIDGVTTVVRLNVFPLIIALAGTAMAVVCGIALVARHRDVVP